MDFKVFIIVVICLISASNVVTDPFEASSESTVKTSSSSSSTEQTVLNSSGSQPTQSSSNNTAEKSVSGSSPTGLSTNEVPSTTQTASVAASSSSTDASHVDNPSQSASGTGSSPSVTNTSSVTDKPLAGVTDSPKMPTTNSQAVRATPECSSKFQDSKGNNAFSFEQSILGSMSADAYCLQMKKSAEDLNAQCTKMADTDNGAAIASAGIFAMVTSFCNNKSSLIFPGEKDKCVESVKKVTADCSKSANMADSSNVFPSDLLINVMKSNACKTVSVSKSCISSGLKTAGGCTEAQQTVFLAPLDFLTNPCVTGAETTTVGPSVPTTTTAGPVMTTKSGRSSASAIQTSVLIAILPILLLVFNF